jgi:hypothetical protein
LGFALAWGFAFAAGRETFFGAGLLLGDALAARLEAGAEARFFGLAADLGLDLGMGGGRGEKEADI